MSIVLFRSVDLETSAMEGGEVVEIGWTDVFFDTESRECGVADPKSKLFGITRPMAPGAQGTHHITPEQLDGLPPCTPQDLREVIAGVDFLIAHNCAYEQAFFTPEVVGEARWLCTFKGALRAWREAPEHNLQALKYWRGLKLDPALALPAHRAGPDAYVGAHIMAELVKTETVNDLVKWTKAPRYYRACPIGKHRGQAWSDIPHSYLTWMMSQAEMEFDLKAAARDELNRRAEQGA